MSTPVQEVVKVKDEGSGSCANVVAKTVAARNKDGWHVVATFVDAYREHRVEGQLYGSHAKEVVLIFEK